MTRRDLFSQADIIAAWLRDGFAQISFTMPINGPETITWCSLVWRSGQRTARERIGQPVKGTVMQMSAEQANAMSGGERGEIDLLQLAREVGRRKWLVLLTGLVAFLGSLFLVNMIKPRYTAETRVLLENRESPYTSIGRDGQRSQEPPIDADAVLSQEQLIQSRDIARTVIRRFDLTGKREFDPLLNGISPVTRIGVMLGLLENPAKLSPEDRAMDEYFDKLKAFAVKKSRVIAVEFQSRDPELAAQLSRAVAEEYIRQLEQAKRSTATAAGSWLSRTIEDLRQRVASAEAKVETFRTQNGLFQVDSERTNLSGQQLSELNTQLATARTQQAELAAKARVIREAIRQGRMFEVSDIVNNEVVRRLIEQRATLRAQIAQAERTLLPQHPRMRELAANLSGLEEQIRAAADRTARTLETDARAAGARVAASQAELETQKRQSGVSNEADVQLRALEREAKAEREQLENFLARYRDASVREADNAVTADARIVAQPTVPGLPSFPKKLPTIILATVAGLVLSLAYVIMRAFLSDGVYVRRPVAYAQAVSVSAPSVTAAVPSQPVMIHDIAPIVEARPAEPPATVANPPIPVFAKSETVVVEAAPVVPLISQSAPSPSAAAMRDALGNLNGALARSRAATSSETEATPVVPALSAPASPAKPAVPIVEAPPFLGDAAYDPLFEIADEAGLALLRGRPVTVLLLGVDVGLVTGAMQGLEAILAKRGPVLTLAIDAATVSAETLQRTVETVADTHSFVLVDGGVVRRQSAAMAELAEITVLVASDDLEDARVEAAAALLAGQSHYIVNTVPVARRSGLSV